MEPYKYRLEGKNIGCKGNQENREGTKVKKEEI